MRSVIGQVSQPQNRISPPEMPPPQTLPPVIETTNAVPPSQAGLDFKQISQSRSDVSSISSVGPSCIALNNQTVNEVFDLNGNPL